MKRHVLDLVLVLVVLVGGVLAWKTGQQRIRLKAEYDRLARKTGDLPVANESKVYVRALATEEPLHFAWRIHLPPNYSQSWSDNVGGTSTSRRTDACDFIARIRFSEDQQGELQVHTHFGAGSGRMGLGDRSLCEFLHGRWDKIQVEQLGADKLVALDPDESAVFVRLFLPEEMRVEARGKLSSDIQQRHVPVLFELKLGSPTSKP